MMYSILYCGQDISRYYNNIKEQLRSGIKVFWFGADVEVRQLKENFAPFADAFLLNTYIYTGDSIGLVEDGMDDNKLIPLLEQECLNFNAAQYRVEHCKESSHIIVEASAGTGKTTVMVDRLMFLMHTVPALSMREICMITFTNAAANQMNERLQSVLMNRFRLTGQKKYLRWLEDQSGMNISTIHSFIYKLAKLCGIDQGFSRGTGLSSMNYDRRLLLKDALDEYAGDMQYKVSDQIGMSFYQALTTIDRYWNALSQMGHDMEDILYGDWDWGEGADQMADNFQNTILGVLETASSQYWKRKTEKNTFTMNELILDGRRILAHTKQGFSRLDYRYLFVDEFQDSDNAQIDIVAWLCQELKLRLFVVGDIKQSIYRFRGATDTAFFILKERLGHFQEKMPVKFTLVNNYRTSANVLSSMSCYFKRWADIGLLSYDRPVVPVKETSGTFEIVETQRYTFNHIFKEIAEKALEELETRLEKTNKTPGQKDRVVVLTRTNRQLMWLRQTCNELKIPAVVRMDGYFYRSEAVKDFYAMISSFVFPDVPKYRFNYLMTPYSELETAVDFEKLEEMHGNQTRLMEIMDELTRQTSWETINHDLRLYPVISVIYRMMDDQLIERFISRAKARKADQGWQERQINAAVFTEARYYKANLKKLMEILQRQMTGEYTSLYDIYLFLKNMIATNREEPEADAISNQDYRSLYCMTVHRAKGLEYDTIIIPFTGLNFVWENDTEILADSQGRIGWFYRDKQGSRILYNSLYPAMREEEDWFVKEEETRILYVAMTRAIRSLYCLVNPDSDSDTWAGLLEEAGVDYE